MSDFPVAAPITLSHIRFSYREGGFQLHIPYWHVGAGQAVAVVGPSGSGKTTLLHLIAGILSPSSGCVQIGETDIVQQTESARRIFRLRHLGLVFQEFELLEHLSVFENLLIPCRLHSSLRADYQRRETACRIAEQLGLLDKLHRYPRALSQGERQRVAVGRALLLEPQVILADEPTGNLDPHNKKLVLNLLLERSKLGKSTVIVATHDFELISHFDRVVAMEELIHGRDGAQVCVSPREE